MAMAGLMKVHGGHSNNGSRGRPYGMMLLLAFGAAIIGVMVLHRFRERRIFNLLIKEKDGDLVSLHLLLQKERDHVKEAKWKLEDMRAKIRILRAQKIELESRIMEMQTTVSSLREEQKTTESALEEKENEVKMLRDKNTHIDDGNQQRVKALTEAFTQKKSENEDLKHHREAPPANIWSVSIDDPSNASVNSQMKPRMTERNEVSVNQGKESSGELHVSSNQDSGENVTEHADGDREESGSNSNKQAANQGDLRSETGGETAENRKMTEEQPVEQDHSIGSNREGRIIEGEGKNSEEMGSAKGAARHHHGEVQRRREETNGGHTSGDKVTETVVERVQGSNSQGTENKEDGANSKVGMTLQILDKSKVERHAKKGKIRGKRLTIVTRSKAGNSEKNGVAVISKTSVKSTSAEILDASKPQNKSSGMRNETGTEDPILQTTGGLKKGEASEHEDSSIDAGQEASNTTGYQQMHKKERTNATTVKTEMGHISLKDAPANMTIQIDESKASSEGKQAMKKEDEFPEQSKTSDFDEEPNDPEVEDFQEQESETETSMESTSNSGEDDEESESKGKTDEPAF